MKKLFLSFAIALMSVGIAKAQTKTIGWSYAAEVGIGSQLELGGHAQYGINQYVAIDAPMVKYNFDYGTINSHEIKLMAGVRGYSPAFAKNLKGLLAIDLGYGGTVCEYTDWTSCFALDVTAGVQINKNLYVGYGFGMLSNVGKHKDHVLRLGWNF